MTDVEDIGGSSQAPKAFVPPAAFVPPTQTPAEVGNSTFVRFLIRKGIVKTQAGGTAFALGLCAVCIIVAILVPIIW